MAAPFGRRCNPVAIIDAQSPEEIKDQRPDWARDQLPDRRPGDPSTRPGSGDIMVG
jgi:hypothetical protein